MRYTEKDRLILIITASLTTIGFCIFSVIRVLILIPSIESFNNAIYYPFSFENPYWTFWFCVWLTFWILTVITLKRIIIEYKRKTNNSFIYISVTVFIFFIVAICPFTFIYGVIDSSLIYMLLDLFGLIFLVTFLYKTIFEND